MKFLSLLAAIIILASAAQSDDSIDAQIEQVMNAKSSERYELMNQLKTKLATMNENERNEALQKLSGGKNLNKNEENHGSSLMLQRHQLNMQKQQMNTNRLLQNQMNAHTSKNKR